MFFEVHSNECGKWSLKREGSRTAKFNDSLKFPFDKFARGYQEMAFTSLYADDSQEHRNSRGP